MLHDEAGFVQRGRHRLHLLGCVDEQDGVHGPASPRRREYSEAVLRPDERHASVNLLIRSHGGVQPRRAKPAPYGAAVAVAPGAPAHPAATAIVATVNVNDCAPTVRHAVPAAVSNVALSTGPDATGSGT